ncbi:MAG: stage III sporulation protein AG [Lachnospiraceae bacterium]|nr:stage III sporulation protein AG [Lachnospiraceae bacterium]
MIDRIKELAKNKNNLVVLVLVGVLLMVITFPLEEKEDISTGEAGSAAENTNNNNGYLNVAGYGNNNIEGVMTEEQLYVAQMEEKLEEVLSKLDGAGNVEVLITLQASEEKIVEKDIPVVRSNTEETDSAGGTRTVSNVDMGESTVYSDVDNNSQPYVIQTISPRIEGVVVLAEGAGSGNVSINLTEAVQVLFGVEAHKIKVMKMEGTK